MPSPPRRGPDLRSFIDEPVATPAARPVPEGPPPAQTVTEVVTAIKRAFWNDPAFSRLWVRGEISGFKAHANGHWYFALKDERAILRAVMFASENARLKFEPEEGMEILARGRIDVYDAKGDLQLYVDEIRPLGDGELAVRYQQIKRKLAAERLFDHRRKRPIPSFPRTLGIVTSLHGAALHDMVTVATARNPGIRIIIAPARVQGAAAADDVARAIARINERTDVDVLIVGRGGGSIEDLWAFNEEVLVRAVAASRIPTVSAVGHETDETLCDLVADRRAATPSNACEIIVPDARMLHQQLDEADDRMEAALGHLVPKLRERIGELHRRSADAIRTTIRRQRDLLAADAKRLDALSPLAVLDRGYSVVKKDDRVLRSVDAAEIGSDITIIARDGELDATIKSKRRSDRHG